MRRSYFCELGAFCLEVALRKISPFHQIVTSPSHHVCCCQKCIPACCQKRRKIGRFQDDDGFHRSPVCEPGCCSCCIFCVLLGITCRLPEVSRLPPSSATRPSRRFTLRRYANWCWDCDDVACRDGCHQAQYLPPRCVLMCRDGQEQLESVQWQCKPPSG